MNNGTTKKCLPGLGARVKELRQRQGLTLQVAATRGGTTPQTLVQLERHDLATTRTLNCVAKALGVSVDEVTGRKAGGQ
ncbi:MAG: helix-turn-helix transcriptional regulator [Myxococcaceae bacterium]|jgi:transcriptional regulator with XRE-family HTH domain|nr:helix-turn-helix transcriptional regulator [Myxococcaceae bacterium]